MMFGLVNRISPSEPDPVTKGDGSVRADSLAAIELYHRSREQCDVIGAEYFHPDTVPAGFQPELLLFPGTKPPPYPPVIIHHKFIVIDAEGDSPKVFTGSANMSTNSTWKNDENRLEIRGSRRMAAIYLAEFMRLYEHYRARAAWIQREHGEGDTFELTKDASWAKKHFTRGSPEWRARLAMVQP